MGPAASLHSMASGRTLWYARPGPAGGSSDCLLRRTMAMYQSIRAGRPKTMRKDFLETFGSAHRARRPNASAPPRQHHRVPRAEKKKKKKKNGGSRHPSAGGLSHCIQPADYSHLIVAAQHAPHISDVVQKAGDDEVTVVGGLDALRKPPSPKDVATHRRHQQSMLEIVVEGVAPAEALDGAAREGAEAFGRLALGRAKVSRKSLVKNLPSFLAAQAVIVCIAIGSRRRQSEDPPAGPGRAYHKVRPLAIEWSDAAGPTGGGALAAPHGVRLLASPA